MKGVEVTKKHDMYLVSFSNYDTMLSYIHLKRPSQMSISFDGDNLTASIPVQGYSVRKQNED